MATPKRPQIRPPWTAETERFARDGVTLAFQRVRPPAGDGASTEPSTEDALPLLMVQGWTGVKEDWRELAPALAADRPVVVFDNRGMGESDVPEGPYSVDQLAADALALTDHLGWERFHLMGISMGGMIAQTAALAAPERIEGLVLGCTTHGGREAVQPDPATMGKLQMQPGMDRREMVRNFLEINYPEGWLAADPARTEALIDYSMAFRRSMAGFMNQMAAVMAFDLADRIHAIDHPTLVVHGDADALLPYPNAEKIAAKVPNARLHTLAGAGHVFWDVDAGESARVIREFLAAGGGA